VRSALLEVEGVTRVQVLLQQGTVIVTYDDRTTTVDALVAAVGRAPGPMGPNPYHASVKEPPRPVASGQ
jgi:copper chaperone CopZ